MTTIDSAALRRTVQQPFGLVVEAPDGHADLRDLAPQTLADWTEEHHVLVLRGFTLLDKPDLIAYCEAWGEILMWDFGAVLDLVIQDDPQNYLFTRGEVPFHWDGAFARVDPRFFLFQCIQAPAEGGGGETVFSDTTRVVAEADPDTVRRWGSLSVAYRTEKLAHYGGEIIKPLLSTHPSTGATTIRYAEPLPADRFLNPLSVRVEGVAAEEQEQFVTELAELLHRDDHCYAHQWRTGDIVVADNHALVHGRNAFSGDASRVLQRIQVI